MNTNMAQSIASGIIENRMKMLPQYGINPATGQLQTSGPGRVPTLSPGSVPNFVPPATGMEGIPGANQQNILENGRLQPQINLPRINTPTPLPPRSEAPTAAPN